MIMGSEETVGLISVNDAAAFDSVHDKLIEACAQKKI